MASSFDPERFYLGTLCLNDHDWDGTGLSVRRLRTGQCRQCERVNAAKYRHYRPLDREALVDVLHDPVIKERVARRLWAKVAQGAHAECWVWTGQVDRNGYGTIGIQIDGHSCRISTHQLAFLLSRGYLPVLPRLVRHKVCGERLCCNPAHLDEGTYRDNADDTARHYGDSKEHWTRRVPPECLPRTVLTTEHAQLALVLCAQGWSEREVGERFGVRQTTIHELVVGHTWKHLPGPRRPGGRARGERCGTAILTAADVCAIRRLRTLGLPVQAIADRYGVCKSTINRILSGKSWAHVVCAEE